MKKHQFDRENNQNFLEDKKIAIIVANFYQDIGEKLLEGSFETLRKYGIDGVGYDSNDNAYHNIDVFYVPGAFEVPLMAKNLIHGGYDGIVTLGAVIQGETPHFDFVCNECARGITQVSLESNIPIAFGVLTTSNMEQTLARAGGAKGNKGVEATMAMIEMLYLKEQK